MTVIKILKLAFEQYPKIYLILFISILSILIEMTAIGLLGYVTTHKMILIGSNLSQYDDKTLFIGVLGLFVLRFISMFYVETQIVFIGKKFLHYLSTTTLEKIFNLPYEQIQNKEMGYYISMSGDDASRVSEVLMGLLKLINSIVLLSFYTILLMTSDSSLLFMFILLFIFFYIGYRSISKKLLLLGDISLQTGRLASSIFLDSLNGLKTIKSFGIEKYILNKFTNPMFDYQMTNYKLFYFSLFAKYIPLIILLFIFAIYIIIDNCNDNKLSISYLLSLLFIIMRFLLSLGDLLQILSKTLGDLKATSNLINFLSLNDLKIVDTIDIDNIQAIKVNNLSFSYTGNKKIFDNINLDIQRGKSYAIIGKTGSGKSTLIDLIMDFLIPKEGEIYINAINTKKINIASLRNKVLYISQEAIIFNDTIKENLSLEQTFSTKDMFEVLGLVDLDEMVNSNEAGLDMLLYYKGTNISGGQKQRLNIARALLRKPDVLILDESVNALDETTRHQIVRNLLNEFKDKILIFVTHDNDILTMVDDVINLDTLKGT